MEIQMMERTNSVSILYDSGIRRGYANTPSGRDQLSQDLAEIENGEMIKTEIFQAWGPVGDEPVETLPDVVPVPTLEERISNQEQAMLALMDTVLMMNGGNGNV